MDQMLKVHDCTAICAPTVAQHAALAALDGPQDVFAAMREALAGRRELACKRLDALAGALDYVRPAGAFYIMARTLFTPEPSRRVAERLIREARVITIPGSTFGAAGEGHLRLSYGAAPEELEEAFDRLARWVSA
jgi:aminotransferase